MKGLQIPGPQPFLYWSLTRKREARADCQDLRQKHDVIPAQAGIQRHRR
jgi:hypothetical protein